MSRSCLSQLAALFTVAAVTTFADAPRDSILHSQLAGNWYPANKTALREEIKTCLSATKKLDLEPIVALILPHAGYRWSGRIAAYGLKQLEGRHYKRVIVLGPSHQTWLPNSISIANATHYSTPLGVVPLDLDFIEKLKRHSFVKSVPEAHSREHSVQIEIPLLQYVLTDFKLVPIVVGHVDMEHAEKIGKTLESMIDSETLLVCSSDFTHYGPRFDYVPFRENISENLKKIDMGAFEQIKKKSVAGFYKYTQTTGATICGRCAIGILLSMVPTDAKATLLKYDTSGNMTGDYSNSVSYMTIAFTKSSPSPQKDKNKQNIEKNGRKPMKNDGTTASNEVLSPQDKENLLKLARKTIEYIFKHKKQPNPDELGVEITPGMKQVMGCFVTLHEHGQLRGCIGEIIPRRPLYEAVVAQANNSAFNDYRFPSLSEEELPKVDIEISALTPSKPVKSYNDIIIGKHGMTLSKHGRSAVFLPQVAPEQGWDLAQTLTHLAMKAGLRPDDWKAGTDFTVFEAIVFHEPQ